MLVYLSACISSFLSGLGIGGGSVFILVAMLFNILNLDEARTYNLLLFISVGVAVSFKNFKNIKKEKKKYIKAILSVAVGAILGAVISKYVPEKITKIIFYVFLLVIGIYEIIVSLIVIKGGKNITMKGDK